MFRFNLTVLLVSLWGIAGNPVNAQVSFGEAGLITRNWKFIPEDVKDGQSVNTAGERWQTVDLPHDWSIRGQLSPVHAACTGYLPGGTGWYRKTVHIPEEKRGEKVYLYFEGVYNRSEVFLNGQSLGKRPNGYVSFMYDATPCVEYGRDNVIAVRVDHSRSADSRWYTGSGIYRDVWIVYAHPVHIALWGVHARPERTEKGYRLTVGITVENGSPAGAALTVQNELVAPGGKVVGRNRKTLSVPAGREGRLTAAIDVARPSLWSLENPVLYQLRTTVLKNGKVIDRAITATGFRTFTFDAGRGFALNGEWMKIKGVCIHHDAGVLGSAVPRAVWKSRLLTLKETGANAIRTSHNPQAPCLYELCDELGLLVLNEMYDEWEFPKRKWIEGWNVGTPGFEGSCDIFREWGEEDLAATVRRDRNHPSIFAWSIGNEVDYPNDPYSHPVLGGEKAGFTQATYGGYNPDAPDAMQLGEIARRLAKAVREQDSSRPVTAGLAGVAMSNETGYPAALDITGYNYTENRYDSDHEKYPDRIIYGSENRHDPEAWKAVRDRAFIFGQFLWTGIDYLGESGRWPSRGFNSGLLDFGGFMKPRGYYRQSLWSDRPVACVGTYPAPAPGSGSAERAPSMDAWPVWNYEEGQSVRVVCYTNAAKAKLLLNGVEAGQTKDRDDRTGIIYWDIPYRAGTLEAVGMDRDNREVSRSSIRSSRQPYALQIVRADEDGGLARVTVQVVDDAGVPVMLSDNEISCHITGPARLLGLEAGNNTDMSDYTDHRHRAFHGRILAYVQSTGEAGDITLRFTSPWLKPAEVRIAGVE